MKKAAIISLYGNNNFGNKLQNYAVQEVLKKQGLEVENIINFPFLNNKKGSLKNNILHYLIKIKRRLLYKQNFDLGLDYSDTVEKQKAFLEFNNNINNTKKVFSFLRVNEFKKYDYYIVGSDQIWNPHFGGLRDLDLLTFTNKTKIALSASFGIDNIPDEYVEKTMFALNEFDAISVREEKGKEIINNLIPEKNVEVLVDPTMMINTHDWDKVSVKPQNMEEQKYVLCYFLGEISQERKQLIEQISKKYNLKVINMLDKEDKFNDCGPGEFVYLESKASLILTDSFHSCVFAILYNNPFIVFNREGSKNNMSSRITTLLNKFELEDRLYKGKLQDNILECDFTKANTILSSEQKRAEKYIKEAISKKGEKNE